MAYRKKKSQQKETQRQQSRSKRETTPPVLTVDYERYAHFLENEDLTDDQKREFCQTLWNIIVEFVSLGFGVHPLQQTKNTSGKLNENPTKPALMAPDKIYLDHQLLSENFKEYAALKPDVTEEGVET